MKLYIIIIIIVTPEASHRQSASFLPQGPQLGATERHRGTVSLSHSVQQGRERRAQMLLLLLLLLLLLCCLMFSDVG